MNQTASHISTSVASHTCTSGNSTEQRSNSQIVARQKIQQQLEQRLQKLGSIRTKEAWQLCKERYPYNTIAFHFKCIMQQRISQGKAERIRNGVYWINKK
jgi:hypothetical protein